jgi:FixJ family two-component response regulator
VSQAGNQPIVWIIDSEQWPRACLRAELIERGFDAVGYVTLSEALSALRLKETPRPQCIVLELRNQPLAKWSLQALARTRIPVIALAGSVELQCPLVKNFKWAAVLRRPLTIGQIADAIEEVIAGH